MADGSIFVASPALYTLTFPLHWRPFRRHPRLCFIPLVTAASIPANVSQTCTGCRSVSGVELRPVLEQVSKSMIALFNSHNSPLSMRHKSGVERGYVFATRSMSLMLDYANLERTPQDSQSASTAFKNISKIRHPHAQTSVAKDSRSSEKIIPTTALTHIPLDPN